MTFIVIAFTLTWAAFGLVVWLMSVLPDKRLTVGYLIALPLYLISGPFFGCIWLVVILTDMLDHALVDWSEKHE